MYILYDMLTVCCSYLRLFVEANIGLQLFIYKCLEPSFVNIQCISNVHFLFFVALRCFSFFNCHSVVKIFYLQSVILKAIIFLTVHLRSDF